MHCDGFLRHYCPESGWDGNWTSAALLQKYGLRKRWADIEYHALSDTIPQQSLKFTS